MELLRRLFRRGRDQSGPKSREEKTAELAGYFLAHAVWCVSDGEILVPLIAHEGREGRQMTRFALERIEQGVEEARKWMASIPDGCERAVMIYDGYCDTNVGRRDALSARAVDCSGPEFSMDIVLPYRSASDPLGFSVHRPKFGLMRWSSFETLSSAFWRGVDRHEKAAKIWQRHADDSVRVA